MTKLKPIKAKIIIETNRNYLEKLVIHSNLKLGSLHTKVFLRMATIFSIKNVFRIHVR